MKLQQVDYITLELIKLRLQFQLQVLHITHLQLKMVSQHLLQQEKLLRGQKILNMQQLKLLLLVIQQLVDLGAHMHQLVLSIQHLVVISHY